MKIIKIKLHKISAADLQAREMNKLLGGQNCCICACKGPSSTQDNGSTNQGGGTSGLHSYSDGEWQGGAGFGAFG
jgi:natural product precursor